MNYSLEVGLAAHISPNDFAPREEANAHDPSGESADAALDAAEYATLTRKRNGDPRVILFPASSDYVGLFPI